MKFTNVDIYSEGSLLLNFNVSDLNNTSPLVLTNIDGLDVDDVQSRFYNTSFDGTKKYHDMVMTERDLVFYISLDPRFELGDDVSVLRDEFFKAISASRSSSIVIRFKDGDTVVAAIEGFVSKIDAPRFSKNMSVALHVTCDDPLFKSLDRVMYDVTTFTTVYKFSVLDSTSTATHGFKMVLRLLEPAGKLIIKPDESPYEWEFHLYPLLVDGVNSGFLGDDILTISGENNDRYVTIERSGVIYDIADTIVPGSTWPLILPSPNVNSFTIESDSHPYVWFELSYHNAHWGI
jgi:hypothetical protein